MITEKEAAEKWCPMVRWTYVPQASLAFNNRVASSADIEGDDPKGKQGRCIGSACMAWRWTDLCLHGGDRDTDPNDRKRKPWHRPASQSPDDFPRLGYCGAFGKVEP